MSNPYRDRLLRVGVISQRSGDKVTEGREHPETGLPFKTVTDEGDNSVTEHSAPGRAPGVSGRQDVNVHPKAVVLKMEVGS
jgi:hypothetical protein